MLRRRPVFISAFIFDLYLLLKASPPHLREVWVMNLVTLMEMAVEVKKVPAHQVQPLTV
jgi:hypothetical protein